MVAGDNMTVIRTCQWCGAPELLPESTLATEMAPAAPFSISDGFVLAGRSGAGDFNGDGRLDIVGEPVRPWQSLFKKSGNIIGARRDGN